MILNITKKLPAIGGELFDAYAGTLEKEGSLRVR